MPKAPRTPRKAELGELAVSPAAISTIPELAEATQNAPSYVVVSHEALFERAAPASRCDACGEGLSDEDEADEGYRVRGHGVYHSVRGDEHRLERVPLCSSCAAAIGMTALARWEIEEEEG